MIEYRNVPEYEGKYRVDSEGGVWSKAPKNGRKTLKEIPWRRKKVCYSNIYPSVALYDTKGKRKTYTIHVLILTAFKGSRPQGMQCCHNDGNVCNNELSNLRWDTPSNNTADKKIHNTYGYGDTSPYHKLTSYQVAQIKIKKASGLRAEDIAKEFGVSRSNIYFICSGITWKNS